MILSNYQIGGLFFRKTKFTEAERIHIEKWQSDIRSSALSTKLSVSSGPSGIGEPANPVKDGREEKIFAVHGTSIADQIVLSHLSHVVGAQVWSAKQAGL